MEIIDNKALKLHLRNPDRVTEVIPKSKVLGKVGDLYEVLVYWGMDECAVLRNLGIKNVPPVIYKDYPWNGLYTPYKHQKETAAFLTQHKRAYCLNEMGCVDSETEYLSPTGWVKISEYTGGDVAQYHPDTREIEFVTPTEYVKIPCEHMIRFKTSRGVDQLLSLEHRMVIHDKTSKKGKWVVMPALEVYDRETLKREGWYTQRKPQRVSISHAAIPATYKRTWGEGLPLSEAELRLQVAVIADGHFGSDTNHCVIRVKKQRKVNRLVSILTASSTEYKTRISHGFHIFTFTAPIRVKEFDSQFYECSQGQIDAIYDEVLHWDGNIQKGNRLGRFSSTSKASADFIQAVFNSKGYIAKISEDTRENKYRGGVCYTVNIREASDGLLHISSNNSTTPTITASKSTDGFKYCFSVPSTFLLFRRNGCVFASGNTGKTSSVLWAADYLMTKGVIKRALVICPLSIMNSAWRADAFKAVMHRTVDVAYGPKQKRSDIINSGADIVIINFDGVGVVAKDIANGGFDLIIIDELNSYKSSQSLRWKTLNGIITSNTWIWGLTGSPASQSPLDAYGIAKLLRPESVPKFMGPFRDMVMNKVTQFKYVPRIGAMDTVYSILQPAIRFTKEECLDLPSRVYITRDVPLTAQQSKYYKMMKEQMLIEAAGEEVTAANAAINLNKLVQIAAGGVLTNEKEVIEFDCSNRLAVLDEIVSEALKKVIVFATFRHSIGMIKDHFDKQHIKSEVIHGGVSLNKRSAIFEDFQSTPDVRVLIIQPKSASHGVTLTAANVVVWWSPTPSVETYLQANDRVHRNGQDTPCTVVHLTGSPVEERFYKALEQKSNLLDNLLGLYKDILTE